MAFSIEFETTEWFYRMGIGIPMIERNFYRGDTKYLVTNQIKWQNDPDCRDCYSWICSREYDDDLEYEENPDPRCYDCRKYKNFRVIRLPRIPLPYIYRICEKWD